MHATAHAAVPRHLPLSLLSLRLTMALFLLPWVVDKFVNPAHAVAVFEGFYGLSGVGAQIVLAIGIAQVAILLLFTLGIARTWSYGLVLLMHAGSTLSSWQQYLDPYTGANLLFFAAWPALGACIALFLLREHDTLWPLGRRGG
jgi:hypothetical protein